MTRSIFSIYPSLPGLRNRSVRMGTGLQGLLGSLGSLSLMVGLGGLAGLAGLGGLVAIATISSLFPVQAAEVSADRKTEAAAELSKMFSQEIRDTLNVCTENGGVNLAKAKTPNGFVVCSTGNQSTKVPYNTYLNTFSDFVSAGFLVGFQAALANDPQAKESSKVLHELFKSESGQGLLKEVLTTALSNSQAIATGSRESLDILVKEVLTRTSPILQDETALDQLFGNGTQYQQIVQKFCTIPGMSVKQAQSEIPGVSNLQLYASCIKASGLTEAIKKDEAAEKKPKPANPETPNPATTSPEPSRPEAPKSQPSSL